VSEDPCGFVLPDWISEKQKKEFMSPPFGLFGEWVKLGCLPQILSPTESYQAF
jgi:hypothetical protein